MQPAGQAIINLLIIFYKKYLIQAKRKNKENESKELGARSTLSRE